MSKEIINKIIDETVDTIIDNIDEVLVDYMCERLGFDADKFFNDKEEMFVKVIKELNNRINNNTR